MASHAARPGPALHPRPGGMFTATATLPSALPPFPPARPPFHGVRGCSSRFAASKWRHSTGVTGGMTVALQLSLLIRMASWDLCVRTPAAVTPSQIPAQQVALPGLPVWGGTSPLVPSPLPHS